MSAYYNEIDPFAAQWLRELIKAGLIAPGDVDGRSIEDVTPNDLRGYSQCHFFAGIGGWSYALRLAGWPDDRPVWTGSCPCQPFSAAGKGAGFADERHLWPSWYWLIQQCRPAIVFGEQVASKATNVWFDLVQADMEAVGYAFGVVPFPAASLGAPHIRDRAYWVADTRSVESRRRGEPGGEEIQGGAPWPGLGLGSELERMADAESFRYPQRELRHSKSETGQAEGNNGERRSAVERLHISPRYSADCWLADASSGQLQEQIRRPEKRDGATAAHAENRLPSPTNGFWRDADWLFCRDGRWRPVESGTSPLAHGSTARVVSVCSNCKTEVIANEEVLVLRCGDRGNEGLEKEKILQSILFSAASLIAAMYDQEQWPLPSQKGSSIHGMLSVWRAIDANSPQRQEPAEQLSREFGTTVRKLPCQSSQKASSHFYLHYLWSQLRGEKSQETKQTLLCPMCEKVGEHLCRAEMGKNRVLRLRGYGNAIVATQAAEFIKTVMEAK